MAKPQQKSEGKKLVLKKGEEKSIEDRERQRRRKKSHGRVCEQKAERPGERGSLCLQEGERGMEGEPAVETKGKWGEGSRQGTYLSKEVGLG